MQGVYTGQPPGAILDVREGEPDCCREFLSLKED